MKLTIAGGCGEHGRNCFLVDCDDVRFLVDCGLMASEVDMPSGGVPRLSKAQISALDYVFLTHSHADHTGALPWLARQGYRGPVIATRETFAQCEYKPAIPYHLDILCPGGHGALKKLSICWGRSGHCEGSVWYKFMAGGKTMVFSGDYTESTLLTHCDKLRGHLADLAVLDCAYGNDVTSYTDACAALVRRATALTENGRPVLCPVPKYGRGPEVLKLLSEALPGVPFYGDTLFRTTLATLPEKLFWYEADLTLAAKVQSYTGQTDGIIFVSDPQLRTEPAQSAARAVLAQGGAVLATGKVEEGSFAGDLLAAGQLEICRYPVHLNRTGYELLKNTNDFAQAIPYHSAALRVPSAIEF